MVKRGTLFSMFRRIELGVGLKIFIFQATGIHGFGGLEFVFSVILSVLTIQCAIAMHRQGSCTSLVHFVFPCFV
jgi:hypothetical protein